MPAPDVVLRTASAVAAGLAFASAAVTAYWVLGGTALLDTVGGYADDLARTRRPLALLVGLLVVGVKAVGGALALGHSATRPPGHPATRPPGIRAPASPSPDPRRGAGQRPAHRLRRAARGGRSTGAHRRRAPDSPVDRRALTWHVLLWDLWFLLWGLALAVTTWGATRSADRR